MYVLKDHNCTFPQRRQNLQNFFLPARSEGVTDYLVIETGTFVVLMKCYAFNLPSQAGKILPVLPKANFKSR